MPSNFTDQFDYERLIDMYKRAVEQNIGNPKLEAFGDQILVQLMPHFERYGNLFVPTQAGHGIMSIWLRCGVVINAGDRVKGYEPGDYILFNTNFGVRYFGDCNPIRVEQERHSNEDQIRFLKSFEIWAKLEFDLDGKVLAYRSIHEKNIDAPVRYAEIIEENWLYGGVMKARRLDTRMEEEEYFELPYLWLERDGDGNYIEKSEG